MLNKNIFIVAIILIIITLVIMFYFPNQKAKEKRTFNDLKDREMTILVINGKKLNIESVIDSHSILLLSRLYQGLSRLDSEFAQQYFS